MADRLEEQVERFAPGFRSRVTARRILTPPVLQGLDGNLVGGALNGGTAAPHQQLFLRPPPARSAPAPRSSGSTWPPPPPTPAAASTGRAAPTRPAPP